MRELTGRRTVPDIRQSEAAECGLACLAMVLGYHGHDVDLGTLRRRHPTSLNGITMRGLITLASRLALTTRALRLDPEQLGQLQLPDVLLRQPHLRRQRQGLAPGQPAAGQNLPQLESGGHRVH